MLGTKSVHTNSVAENCFGQRKLLKRTCKKLNRTALSADQNELPKKKTKQMDEKKYKLICVRKGKTNYARTNNRKNVTLGSYTLVKKSVLSVMLSFV